VCMSMYACVCVYVHVCVYVCVQDLGIGFDNILAFDQNDVMYTGLRFETDSFSLYTVDPSDGSTSLVCTNTDLARISAVEIFRGVFPCGEPPEETGPVVIIPTMGQWGMIIATIFLGFFAVVALRRRIKS